VRTKIFNQIGIRRKKKVNLLFALSFLLLSGLISFSLISCGGGGGGGGSSSGGTIDPALFSGWEMTNGPFSGMVYSLAVDPNNSQRVFAALEEGGLFRSDNGGQSWTHIEESLTNVSISAVAVAGDGQAVYVGTGSDGVYKSLNGGQTWTQVSNGLPIDPKTSQYYEIYKITIDPTNANIVYALSGDRFYLCRTTNGGASWTRIDGGGLPWDRIETFAIHPDNDQWLYVGTNAFGVYKSENMGTNWNEINGNLPPYVVHFPCLAIDPDNNTLYAGSRDYGLYKTVDEGTTWQFIEVGPNTVNENWDAYVLAMDPIDKSTMYTYVETVSPVQPADDGIYRTFDGGGTWEKVPFHEYPGTYRPVREIAVAPSNGNVVYVTTQDSEGLFMTNNIMSVEDPSNWIPIGNGLVDLLVLAMILDPWDNKIVYAGTDEGLYKTTDGGLTWERKGLKGGVVFALVIDPMNASIIYAATENEVYRTTNGGESWSGPGGYWFNSLAIGKDQDRNIIYGGDAFGMGIYKAVDDGSIPWNDVIWEEKNNGLSGDEKYVTCLAIDPSDPSILYAGIAGKVLKTQDGGDTWERKVDGLPPDESIISLAIDPFNPQILYAGTSVGFYASNDGGDTWEFRDGGLGQRYIRSLAIDPMDSMKVCTGTYDDGVFASIDGGENWTQIDQGLTGDLNKRIISLAMDIRDIDNPVGYAGTGCGVFKAYK
jgi:photosystem II stability/assembly factor-like uncharacterized protein